ncbi:copper resistance CopC family protein [Microbacterium sp. SS28]|uniref:copper resistance CopC family protein n=1 Tax=Microbacterium sp. SS28 TaxID=2919948 RepID=UPI001FAB2F7A|nr:copper resistance CopC family protein [Microbacterium sp. SS28]
MSSHGINERRLPRPLATLVVAVVAAASLLLGAAPASAHDELVSTDPAAGSAVAALPDELTLTFSGVLATDAGASEVAVTDATGASLVDGAPVASDTVLTQALAGEASGVVTVLWKVVSSDGHPISGEFSFTVDGPASSPTTEPTAEPTPTDVATAAPTAEPTPSASPVPPAETTDLRPWFVGALLLVLAVAGGVMYLLISRARRERALSGGAPTQGQGGTDDGPADGRADGSQPGSEPPADR